MLDVDFCIVKEFVSQQYTAFLTMHYRLLQNDNSSTTLTRMKKKRNLFDSLRILNVMVLSHIRHNYDTIVKTYRSKIIIWHTYSEVCLQGIRKR